MSRWARRRLTIPQIHCLVSSQFSEWITFICCVGVARTAVLEDGLTKSRQFGLMASSDAVNSREAREN